MNRSVSGFHRDEEGQCVAELDCGHVLHAPEGREPRIGTPLECALCDRSELPRHYAPYRRTPDFSDETVPDALLADHSTKRGVWGLIHVARGRLEYHVQSPLERSEVLTPDSLGVIAPEVKHRVACPGPVEFFVEFWRLRR